MKRKIFLKGKDVNGKSFEIELTCNKIENFFHVPSEVKLKDKFNNEKIIKLKDIIKFNEEKNSIMVFGREKEVGCCVHFQIITENEIISVDEDTFNKIKEYKEKMDYEK